jgi:hypothetical protein
MCGPDDYFATDSPPGNVATELVVSRSGEVLCVVRSVHARASEFSFELIVRVRQPSAAIAESFAAFCGTRPIVEFHDAIAPPRMAVEFEGGPTFERPGSWSADREDLSVRLLGASQSELRAEVIVPQIPTMGYVTFLFDWRSMGAEEAKVKILARSFVDASHNDTRRSLGLSPRRRPG